jgi:phosphatidylethanolamine-binding protein (PEBP) family uncharacterized protein
MERCLPDRSIPVAQRTGAERLLASAAQAASAGAILALAAAAAFCLAGCGGGSSDSTSRTNAAPANTAQSGGSTSAAAKNESSSESNAEALTKAGSSTTGPRQGKHGTRIAQPKGAPEQAPTPEQITQATVADITLESPAITASQGGLGALPATYTCDGKDTWPTLRWTGVPQGTAELALFAMNVQPVEEKLFADWAVAGLDPSLTSIDEGRLPKGAVVGTNGFGKRGYSICPPGEGETYMFALYALPKALKPHKGFEPRAFRKEVLAVSGNVGLLPLAYLRG